jgi:hypothetical protein
MRTLAAKTAKSLVDYVRPGSSSVSLRRKDHSKRRIDTIRSVSGE